MNGRTLYGARQTGLWQSGKGGVKLNIDAIIQKANSLLESKPLVFIAIEGGGGAGKSTLAQSLAARLVHAQIVHMDDFYKLSAQHYNGCLLSSEAGGDYDIARLLEQVIIPLSAMQQGDYYRNDWQSNNLIYDGTITPHGVVIVEGCYSMVAELRSYYDISIFVNCHRGLRLNRGLQRDGVAMQPFWEQWMASEDRYLEEQSPNAYADFLIDGELPYDTN